MLFAFDSILDQNKTQEIYDKVASEDLFSVVYCPVKYITQKMRDKAIGGSLAALKLIPNWFITQKMIRELFTYEDENILYLMKILVISPFLVMKCLFLI